MTPPLLALSAPDSAGFGMRILRGRLDTVVPKVLAAEIIAAACDVAIVRVPSTRSAPMAALARWALPVQHADTLVYYQCDLHRYDPLPLRNADIQFAHAGERDIHELRAMIAKTFHDYPSHYHANPWFARDKVLAGYQEWAESHATNPDCTLWTARRDGRLVAFAACREDPDSSAAEGILYGVDPRDAGGGLYGDLIRHTQAVAKKSGLRTMEVSTQVGNFAVQKVWAREGFHMVAALDTFHVNALLSFGAAVVDRPVTFDGAAIAKFVEVSGDANPIHLDDAAARAAGFPARIAHGLMAANEFSRILGTEVPGPGTVFGNVDIAFLHPLVADQPYRLQMRIPGGVKHAGPMHAVLTVHAGDGSPCVIARSDVFLKH